MIKGIVYKYTSPSGKMYIGQTINEGKRRATFINLNLKYGGSKIDNARKKHLPENFQYEVLYENWFEDAINSINALDEKEKYFISFFDTYETGYNSTLGGGTSTGYHPNEEVKKKMSEAAKKVVKNDVWKQNISESLTGKKHSAEHIKKSATSHKKKVNMFDLEGNLICTYDSVNDAAIAVGTTKSHISDVIHKRRKTYKKHIYSLVDNNEIYLQFNGITKHI